MSQYRPDGWTKREHARVIRFVMLVCLFGFGLLVIRLSLAPGVSTLIVAAGILCWFIACLAFHVCSVEFLGLGE